GSIALPRRVWIPPGLACAVGCRGGSLLRTSAAALHIRSDRFDGGMSRRGGAFSSCRRKGKCVRRSGEVIVALRLHFLPTCPGACSSRARGKGNDLPVTARRDTKVTRR